jgi:hypothetical protein
VEPASLRRVGRAVANEVLEDGNSSAGSPREISLERVRLKHEVVKKIYKVRQTTVTRQSHRQLPTQTRCRGGPAARRFSSNRRMGDLAAPTKTGARLCKPRPQGPDP